MFCSSILPLFGWGVGAKAMSVVLFQSSCYIADLLAEAVFQSKKYFYCIFLKTSPFPRETTVFSFKALVKCLSGQSRL